MNLLNYDVMGLIKLQTENKVSAKEIHDFYLSRALKLNPSINALYDIEDLSFNDFKINTPLIPMPIKELADITNKQTFYGSNVFKNYKAEYTRDAVQQLFDKGFTYFGRSKACEFGLLPFTDSHLHGPTKNPWDLETNSGGSSGGAGASVAAGLSPIAYATDGGGSTRIPAAWTGTVGFKPSRGRVSPGPKLSYSFLSCPGVITRSVRDQVYIYENIWTGRNLNDWIPPINTSNFQEQDFINGNKVIKIGLLQNTPFSSSLNNEANNLVKDFCHRLTSISKLQLEIKPIKVEFGDPEVYKQEFIKVWASMLNGVPFSSELENHTLYLLELAQKTNSLELQIAFNKLSKISKNIFKQFISYDFIICPTLPNPAPKNSVLNISSKTPETLLQEGFETTPYTPWVNMMGLPALSIPTGYWKNGMPFGAQIISTKFQDDYLLRFAAVIECALGYKNPEGTDMTVTPLAPNFNS